MKKFLILIFLFLVILPCLSLADNSQDTGLVTLTNADVIEMVTVGISTDIIIAKIQKSPVNFDLSTKGLIDLKNANVPSNIVTLMIDRPIDSAPAKVLGQNLNKNVNSLADVKTIFITASTEAIRATAEETILKLNGPKINHENINCDAVLNIGIDAGPEHWSFWTGLYYSTAKGSMTLGNNGQSLWIATDELEAHTAIDATNRLEKKLATKFVQDWQAAKQEQK